MSFLRTLDISASALTAERFRMDIIAQNMANINTTRTPNGGAYRRQMVVFQERQLNFNNSLQQALGRQKTNVTGGGVRVPRLMEDPADLIPVYSPSHPDADEDGYVTMPNVDRTKEMVDMMAANRSYEANITTLNVIKSMAMKASEITR